MHRVFWSIVVAGIVSLSVHAIGPGGSSPQESATRRTPSDVVAIVLHDTGRSGSLAYGWKCVRHGDFSDPFRVIIPLQEGSAVQRLRTAFAKNPSFKIGEDTNGLVRVFGEGAKPDLLGLRIKRIVFHREPDPMRALSTILNSPEIRAYVKEHHIDIIPVGSGIYPSPSATSPRLDGTKENVSLSEALDLLPLTYGGMWIYRECTGSKGKRLLALHFSQWSLLRVRDAANR